ETTHPPPPQTKPPPPASEPALQRQNITKQRDQRPGFLRVPAPEPSPGIICPNTAENRARGQQQHAELKHTVEPEMHWRVCARRRRIARIPPEKNMPEP